MYPIILIMIIGILLSVAMILPYPTKSKREEYLAEQHKMEDVIECEYSDWKLWILRGVTLIVMAVVAERTYAICETARDFFVMCLLYIGMFLLHYFIYLKLDRKFYLSPRGLWVNVVLGEPIPYDQIKIVKLWKTIAPFTGCHGNLKVRIKVQSERCYTITVPADDEDEDEELSDQQKLLSWLPESEMRQFVSETRSPLKGIGIVISAVGIFMVIFFGILTFLGLGAGERFSADNEDYKAVLEEEPALHGTIDAIYEDGRGQFYALFRDYACVNIYNNTGDFLYAYKVPEGEKGSIEFAVQTPYVYIKNKDDMVYIYHEKSFLKKVALNDLSKQTHISFVADEANLNKSSIIRKPSALLSGDRAVPYFLLGIVVIICGLAIYNKGRYSLRQRHINQ